MTGSSTAHLAISSSPFLFLFSYFFYVAYQRPFVLQEALNNGGEDVTIIPLMDMLHTNLITLVCWCCMAVYTGVFVRKRRNLMKQYMEESNTLTVIGNVYHEKPKNYCIKFFEKFAYTDLAYVTYKHPDGNYEDGRTRFVEKKIRTYHPYHRENVPILVLKDFPFSGQPKADVERDVASFQSEYAIRNRDKLNQVVFVCFCWIVFCISGALYMIRQMKVVRDLNVQNEEDEESVELAWKYFIIYTCVIVPVIAVFCNWLQWALHRKRVVGVEKRQIL